MHGSIYERTCTLVNCLEKLTRCRLGSGGLAEGRGRGGGEFAMNLKVVGVDCVVSARLGVIEKTLR